MGVLITGNSNLQCSFGMAPSVFNVLPAKRVMGGGMPAATIQDQLPFVNIMPFGMCTSLMNPSVAAATAAALGALTPMPCTPMITGPWIPGSPTVLIGGVPALNNTCKLMCAYGGVIQVAVPAAMTIQVK